ncbi:hypothetical protein LTS17_004180 [Exophiala oligosperma]
MSSSISPSTPSSSYPPLPSSRITRNYSEDEENNITETSSPADDDNDHDQDQDKNDIRFSTTTSSSSCPPPPPPSPSPAYEQPMTFSTVIDKDHDTINRLAGRLRRSGTASPERARLLREVTWRLVRHDVSEDLVMRPAFVAQLGQQGQEMAEHDRQDHDRAKNELLALFEVGPDRPDFVSVLDRLFAELLEHMRVESGEQIPALERMLDPLESQRLGKEYIRTQILTPDLELTMDDNDRGLKVKVWKDVEDYARTDLSTFKKIYARVCQQQNKTRRAGHEKGKL